MNRKYLNITSILLIIFFIPKEAFSEQFTNQIYSGGKTTTLTFTDNLFSVKEETTSFYVSFYLHQANYSFPKQKENQNEIRIFLQKQLEKNAKLKLVVNPISAEIQSISSVEETKK